MNIRIVSPSGFCSNDVIDAGVATLRSWGHTVTLGENAKNKFGRYAGTAEERAKDIVSALEDPDVDVIYASRGGYGAVHLFDKIPLELIKSANKPIFGYSDITLLHALWQKAGVRSVHCHMMRHLGESATHPTTLAIKKILENLSAGLAGNDALCKALAMEFQYPLIGGNLAVVSGLHGTPFDFDYADKILFIEDIAESPYKIERMMYQLRYGGVFDKIKGMIVGQFTDCNEDPEMPKTIYETISEMVEPFGVPVIFDAPIGHVENNCPIVEGVA